MASINKHATDEEVINFVRREEHRLTREYINESLPNINNRRISLYRYLYNACIEPFSKSQLMSELILLDGESSYDTLLNMKVYQTLNIAAMSASDNSVNRFMDGTQSVRIRDLVQIFADKVEAAFLCACYYKHASCDYVAVVFECDSTAQDSGDSNACKPALALVYKTEQPLKDIFWEMFGKEAILARRFVAPDDMQVQFDVQAGKQSAFAEAQLMSTYHLSTVWFDYNKCINK